MSQLQENGGLFPGPKAPSTNKRRDKQNKTSCCHVTQLHIRQRKLLGLLRPVATSNQTSVSGRLKNSCPQSVHDVRFVKPPSKFLVIQVFAGFPVGFADYLIIMLFFEHVEPHGEDMQGNTPRGY
jgi:hypothetical protein